MDIEELFVAILEEIEKSKEKALTPELKRCYAIMNTEIEKIYAFFLVYVMYQALEGLGGEE